MLRTTTFFLALAGLLPLAGCDDWIDGGDETDPLEVLDSEADAMSLDAEVPGEGDADLDAEARADRVRAVDEELRRNRARLALIEAIDVHAVSLLIGFDSSTAILSGPVPDEQTRADALAAVRDLDGVDRIDDRMRIADPERFAGDGNEERLARRTTEQQIAMTTQATTARARLALLEELGSYGLDLQVLVAADGKADVWGTLPNPALYDRAMAALAKTPGVETVSGDIEVVGEVGEGAVPAQTQPVEPAQTQPVEPALPPPAEHQE